MNFVLTYYLKSEGQQGKNIEDRIDLVLQPYRYSKTLSTFYVIHVDSFAQWEQILAGLTVIAEELSGSFYFIMSPPVSGGRYNGYLPKALWNTINGITALD